jgi:hypothetical protein
VLRNITGICTVLEIIQKFSFIPEIPGLEGFDKGLEPSKDGSIPLERDPSTRISASSISSQAPPIWRK